MSRTLANGGISTAAVVALASWDAPTLNPDPTLSRTSAGHEAEEN